MCGPRVTRHTSIRYSISCHTRFNMGASIFFTAAMIRAFRSARSRGNVVTNTRYLTHSHKKNSAKCQWTSGAIASVVGHFQTHALSNILVTLCSGTDEPHSGSGQDFRLAGIGKSVCFVNTRTCPTIFL